jgi:chemotaxis protein CheC
MKTTFNDLELDALREVANIGAGGAGTALSMMIGMPVDLSVPSALALPLADAVDAAGPADSPLTAIALPIFGDLQGVGLLSFSPDAAATLCGLLGVEPESEDALSMLSEIGNILSASYLTSLGQLTGLQIEPGPPQAVRDMLGAILATLMMEAVPDADTVLLLDSHMHIEGTPCEMSFMLLPNRDSVAELLARLGFGE